MDNDINRFINTQHGTMADMVNKVMLLLDDNNINVKLLDIIYRDNLSDVDKYDGILDTLKDGIIKYIKQYGIIIDKDSHIDLRWLYDTLYTVKQFDNLNSVEYMLISDNLSLLDNDDVSIIDITYKIFRLINPNIKEEVFNNNIEKVYPEFLDTFKKYIDSMLLELDGDYIDDSENELPKEIIDIVNLFIDPSLNRLPDIVSTLIESPITLDMLIINGDNKYLTEVKYKLQEDADYFTIMDYYVIRLLNNVDVKHISSDLLDIVDKDINDVMVVVLNFLNTKDIPNTLSHINKTYLERG